ncbi:DUF2971 domain-containing protein [Bradyrhizobium sp. USDA 4506]
MTAFPTGKGAGSFHSRNNCLGFQRGKSVYGLEHSRDYFESIEELQPPFDQMADGIRIASFGSERDNLLMWSHYGDGLRGFCIVFDEQRMVRAKPEGYITDAAGLANLRWLAVFVYAVAHDQEVYHVTGNTGDPHAHRISRQDRAARPDSGLSGCRQCRPEAKHEMWQHAFAAKPLEWSYEEERRLLVHSGREDSEPNFRKYPKACDQ